MAAEPVPGQRSTGRRGDPPPVRKVGGCALLSAIGRDGPCEVHAARSAALQKDVVVKILPAASAARPQVLAEFVNGMRKLSRLNVPGIPKVLSMGQEEGDGVPYAVTEAARGTALDEFLRQEPSPDAGDPVRIAMRLLEALRALHEIGMAHGGLKPQDILIGTDGVPVLREVPLFADGGEPAGKKKKDLKAASRILRECASARTCTRAASRNLCRAARTLAAGRSDSLDLALKRLAAPPATRRYVLAACAAAVLAVLLAVRASTTHKGPDLNKARQQISLLGNPSKPARVGAEAVLSAMGPEVLPLVARSAADPDSRTRSACARLLAHHEEFLATVERLASDPDWRVRKDTIVALGPVPSDRAIPILKRAVNDSTKSVKDAAEKVLAARAAKPR